MPARGVTRWVVVSVVAILLLYSFFGSEAQDSNSSVKAVQSSWLFRSGRIPSTLTYDTDLHSLKRNDDFLPYFRRLHQIPELSLNDAAASCAYTEQELLHFQFGQDDWYIGFPPPPEKVMELRKQWQEYVKSSLIPWTSVKDKYHGRGIVIVAGHPKSLMRVKVILRALQAHGSTLPVELNFWGNELQDVSRKELQDLYGKENIYFNDLSSKEHAWQTTYDESSTINYQLKTAALLNTRFMEPLLLDSDNIPAVDPAKLWESNVYKEHGSIFWPDFTRTREQHPAWAVSNTPCRRQEYEFESGQVLVDKRRTWYHLQLAAWMNLQEFWRDTLLGDKDQFRFAWHALKTEFGRPRKWITSIGFVAEQENTVQFMGPPIMKYCGHTFAQHYPDHSGLAGDKGSGIMFLHGGTLKTISAPLAARLRTLKGGMFTHYKRAWVDEDWTGIEYDVGLRKFDAGWYYNYTEGHSPESLVAPDEDLNLDGVPIGKGGVKEALTFKDGDWDDEVMCVDWEHVEARRLDEDFGEEGAAFEQLFEKAGGYWTIEDGYRRSSSGS